MTHLPVVYQITVSVRSVRTSLSLICVKIIGLIMQNRDVDSILEKMQSHL